MKTSATLLQFYKDVLNDEQSDKERCEYPWRRNNQDGLCGNLEDWHDARFGITRETLDAGCYIKEEMRVQFQEAGCTSVHYPFNDHEGLEYYRESRSSTIFENPTRIAFLKARIAEGENDV